MESEKNSAASENAASQVLVERLAARDEAAAAEIFRRYLRRLTALARARLAPQVGRRVDPEDAVQSAFRSFFLGARAGRFTIEESGDLWRLLATITARKVARAAVRHRSAKRSVMRDAGPIDGVSNDLTFLVDRLPSPEEAAALADELTDVMRGLPANQRRALTLRLEDASIDDIAERVGCTPRTVRRWLDDWRQQFERRLIDDATPLRAKPNVNDVDESVTASSFVPGAPATTEPLPTVDYRDLVLELHLGSGGMGRVYRARQRSTERQVAVKVLKKNRQQNRAAVERFLAEAELIARLDHPGIVKLLGIGRMPAGGYFFTMQLAEGGDLQQRIDAGNVSPSQITSWLRQAAEAVAHAHVRSVIHCDLKPSNLLLDRDDHIVVSDFGFAVALAGNSPAIGGTRAYIAPELLARGEVSEQTDVWGLGAVLYALLFGKSPWLGDSQLPLFADQIDWSQPTMAPGFLEICRRGLAVNPRDRYASAFEFAAALN